MYFKQTLSAESCLNVVLNMKQKNCTKKKVLYRFILKVILTLQKSKTVLILLLN